MQASVPPTVLATIDSDAYEGGGLVALPESKFVKTPTAKELSSNIMWLKPLVTYSPTKARVTTIVFFGRLTPYRF